MWTIGKVSLTSSFVNGLFDTKKQMNLSAYNLKSSAFSNFYYFSECLFLYNRNMQLIQLYLINRCRCVRHHAFRIGILRECDDIAD